MKNLSIEELKRTAEFMRGYGHAEAAQAIDELIALRELKGDQVPYAYSYNYAGCETCEGFQDWRKELSRERPPEWMVETGKVTDLVELFTSHGIRVKGKAS